MQEDGPRRYSPGLELYHDPAMGLCGIANGTDGAQTTYQYLTEAEAVAWLDAWLRGEHWMRSPETLKQKLSSDLGSGISQEEMRRRRLARS